MARVSFRFRLVACAFVLSMLSGVLHPHSTEAQADDGPNLEVPERIEVFRIYPCQHCDQLEAFFTREGIPYISYDLKNDEDAEKDYLENIGRGLLPVTRVQKRYVRGYKPLQVLKLIQGEEIEPPKDWETMDAGPKKEPEEKQLSPEELGDRLVKRRQYEMAELLKRYDKEASKITGEKRLLYTQMARMKLVLRLLNVMEKEPRKFEQQELTRPPSDIRNLINKEITLAQRVVRKRHGRMIAINKKLLKKWRDPLAADVKSTWSTVSASVREKEVARAQALLDEASQGEAGEETETGSATGEKAAAAKATQSNAKSDAKQSPAKKRGSKKPEKKEKPTLGGSRIIIR